MVQRLRESALDMYESVYPLSLAHVESAEYVKDELVLLRSFLRELQWKPHNHEDSILHHGFSTPVASLCGFSVAKFVLEIWYEQSCSKPCEIASAYTPQPAQRVVRDSEQRVYSTSEALMTETDYFCQLTLIYPNNNFFQAVIWISCSQWRSDESKRFVSQLLEADGGSFDFFGVFPSPVTFKIAKTNRISSWELETQPFVVFILFRNSHDLFFRSEGPWRKSSHSKYFSELNGGEYKLEKYRILHFQYERKFREKSDEKTRKSIAWSYRSWQRSLWCSVPISSGIEREKWRLKKHRAMV